MEPWRAPEGSAELRRAPESLRRAPESLLESSGEPLDNWLKVTACDPAGGSRDHKIASLAG
eukprot:845593-Alexandrium_andersonii.AAC.1